MDETDVLRMRKLWAANRDKMPTDGRSLCVFDCLPGDPLSLDWEIAPPLPKTVRFEARRVVLSDDQTTGAIQILANGVPIALEGYHVAEA